MDDARLCDRRRRGNQALAILPWMLLVGPPDGLTGALLMGAAWVINLAVPEYVIRRRLRPLANRVARR
ncbi:hypothetical protein J7E83_18725 [Arthrobacter sp. ISL-48]|uniref:DUF2306 domain-containing protein n=1 Tax=Arthrobacter sp. ISL-48 TaxID=2819110 RepID=UPI001BE752C3|nr:DUF2306 domain-containing protein [Arthrobacter sp. ISL-48]MBT2534122.1 hypothetical protein [Arthrobacter sp. ISL-48]